MFHAILDNYSPDQISAFWTGVAAIATVAAAGVAVRTLRSLEADGRERSRPVLSAEFSIVPLARAKVELCISNVGVGVARDVRVTFSDFPAVASGERNLASAISERYRDPISCFPPGRVWRNIYFAGTPGQDGKYQNREPLPDEVVVSFAYSDDRGRRYQDDYPLSLRLLLKETFSSKSGDDHERRQTEALEVIAGVLGRRV